MKKTIQFLFGLTFCLFALGCAGQVSPTIGPETPYTRTVKTNGTAATWRAALGLGGAATNTANAYQSTNANLTLWTAYTPDNFPSITAFTITTNYFSTNALMKDVGGTLAGDLEISKSSAKLNLTSLTASAGEKIWSLSSFLGQFSILQDNGSGTFNYMVFDVASGRYIESVRTHLFDAGVRIAGKATNDQLTANTIIGVGSDKALKSVTLSGATFDGTTLTITGGGGVATNAIANSGGKGTNTEFYGFTIFTNMTGDRVAVFGSNKELTNSPVTTTTLGYLDATSSIQTQLDAKQASLNTNSFVGSLAGRMTNGIVIGGVITNSPLTNALATASKVAVYDAAQRLTNSTVSTTELGYLGGASSSIQSQLNIKAPTNLPNLFGANFPSTATFTDTGTSFIVDGMATFNGQIYLGSTGSGYILQNLFQNGVAYWGDDHTLTNHATVDQYELGYLDNATGNIQDQLNNLQATNANLTALAGVSTTGILVRTGAGAIAARTINAGSSKISVSNGNGVSDHPSIDLGAVTVADIQDAGTAARANSNSFVGSLAGRMTNGLIIGGTITNTALTNAMAAASSIAAYDASGRLTNATIGSGLTYSGGALSATGGGGSGAATNLLVKSAAYQVLSTDNIIFGNAAGTTNLELTLPDATTCPGKILYFKKIDNVATNFVSVTNTGSQTIDGLTRFILMRKNDAVSVASNGTNWLVLDEPAWSSYSADVIGTTSAAGEKWLSYGMVGELLAAQTIQSNTLYAFPVVIPRTSTIDQAGWTTGSGGANSTYRLGIFRDDGSGYPGQLVADVGADATTANGTAHYLSNSLPVTVQAGRYWLVGVSENISSPHGIPRESMMSLGRTAGNVTTHNFGWTKSQNYTNFANINGGWFPAGGSTVTATPIPVHVLHLSQ
jgi:hypothetical protein